MNQERSIVGKKLKLSCFLSGLACLGLYEYHILQHTSFVSEDPFLTVGDMILTLILIPLPFGIVHFLASISVRFKKDETAGRVRGITSGLVTVLAISLLIYILKVSPSVTPAYRGVVRWSVILLPIIAIPASILVYVCSFVFFSVWSKALEQTEEEMTNDETPK